MSARVVPHVLCPLCSELTGKRRAVSVLRCEACGAEWPASHEERVEADGAELAERRRVRRSMPHELPEEVV